MILHTLNAGVTSSAFSDCLAALGRDDALLLIGDGVYGAIAGTPACLALQDTGASLYVLHSAAVARGVSTLGETATVVDSEGFVELSERFERQMAWY